MLRSLIQYSFSGCFGSTFWKFIFTLPATPLSPLKAGPRVGKPRCSLARFVSPTTGLVSVFAAPDSGSVSLKCAWMISWKRTAPS